MSPKCPIQKLIAQNAWAIVLYSYGKSNLIVSNDPHTNLNDRVHGTIIHSNRN